MCNLRLFDWDRLAAGLAEYARANWPELTRAVVSIALPQGAGRVAGVFGSLGHAREADSTDKLAHFRERVGRAGLGELGFGRSEDGSTWALLVGASRPPRPFSPGRSGPAPEYATLLGVCLETDGQITLFQAGDGWAEEVMNLTCKEVVAWREAGNTPFGPRSARSAPGTR